MSLPLPQNFLFFIFTGHKDSVTCTLFSHDSKFVCTGDMSGIIKVWDTQSGQEVWNFETGGDLEVSLSTVWGIKGDSTVEHLPLIFGVSGFIPGLYFMS